ncbi:MAG: autotransporter-associated beta strand repeat-containing protein [Verrucomicrobiota bacterium]
MKPKTNNRLMTRLQAGTNLMGLGYLLLTASTALGANAYWDTNGATAGSGNAGGTWGNTTWTLDATGASATGAWVDGNSAIFSAGTDGTGGGGWTVTLAAPVTTPSITFAQAGSKTITGNTLTIGGGIIDSSAVNNVNDDIIVNSALAGSGGLTIKGNGNNTINNAGGGGGEFRLGGTNTFSGGLAITAGTVSWASDAAFGNAANEITLNGGGLLNKDAGPINSSRNIRIGASGGAIRGYGGSVLVLNGTISNASGVASAALRRTDSGTVRLNNAAQSSFIGALSIGGGDVELSAANADWSNTDIVMTVGGRLMVTGTGTAVVNSLDTSRDIHFNNGTLLNVDTGNITLGGNFWYQTSGGATGKLTSSSGSLSVTGGPLTGDLATPDQQFRIPIVDFNGSTPLAVTKNGVNRLVLTAASTYTGGTTINAGNIRADNAAAFGTGLVTVANTAQAYLNTGAGVYANSFAITGNGPTEGGFNFGAIRFNNNTISGGVTIGATGARIGGTGAVTGTISGALGGGNVPLEINSSATNANAAVTLSGNATAYTGTTTVTQGSLTIASTTTFGGAVVKATGTTLTNHGVITKDHSHTTGTLQGTGSFLGNLSLNGSTVNDVLNIVPGALHVDGDLTLSGSTTVRASGLGGAVTVLTYDGTLTGDETNLSLENAGSFRGLTAFDTSVPGIITLNIDGADIVWSGAINRDWDTTTNNWQNAIANDKYFQSDNVTFGNSGAGTVNIIGAITPGSITVANSFGSDYTISGGGANVISGTTGITKTGDGNLTLTSANTFLGAVSLSGGTTTFSASQAYTGGTTINNDAVLNLSNGGGQTGTIRGTVNINDDGILKLSTNDSTGYSAGTDRISTINVNGGTLEINNPNGNQTLTNMALNLTGGAVTLGGNGYNGNIDIFGGGSSITSLASDTTSVFGSGVNVGLRQANTTFTVASGTTATGIDLQIDGTINCSAYTFANPNLIKNGPGTLCLNNTPGVVGGTTIYTGTTTINAGTLLVGDGGDAGIIGTGEIIDNSALVFNQTDLVTVPNTITGTGTLEQRGDGALVLTAGGARSGATTVNAGSLYVGSTPFTASSFTVNSPGNISAGTTTALGTGTIPALALDGGSASFRVSTASSDQLVVTSANGFSVTSPASIAVTPVGSLQTGNIIPLIDYSGTFSGFGNLQLDFTGNPHLDLDLVHNTVDTRVDLSVISADTIIWIGNNDNVWDEDTTSNWQTVSDSQTSKFYTFDKVKFTYAGSANTTVDLSYELIPSSVEFDASIDYILTGSNIGGSASLVKNNTGTATLSNPNTYTGTTTINGGTLQLGDSGTLGTTAITNNATFAFNVSTPRTDTHAIAGSGQVAKRGSGELTLAGASTFTGPVVVEAGTLLMPANNGAVTVFGTTASGVTVNPGATLNTNGNNVPSGETISFAGTGVAGFALTGNGTTMANLVLTGNATIGTNNGDIWFLGTGEAPISITGGFTLTKAGASRLWYRAPADGSGNSLAAVIVTAGVFGIESNDNGLSGVPITVNTGGTLSGWAKTGGVVPSSQNNPLTLNGGALGADFDGQMWTGSVTLTANSTLGAATSAQDFTIAGVISQTAGSFGLTKTETSIATLTAVNTYTGNTTVNTGEVVLADNAGLKFVVGATSVNNKVTGAGTATINGDFTLDTTGTPIANGSWTLVDTATKSFGGTFTVVGFTETADVHTKVVGNQTWTFTESSGVLSLAVTAGGYNSWVANYPTLPLDQRDAGDDYDADGYDNLLEYALGGSPLVSGAAALAPAGVPDGSNFVVTFKRSDLSEADTTQVLQYGNDLVGWTDILIGASPGAGMVAISENIPTADFDTVTVTIPTDDATEFFTHLKVTKP